MTSFPREIHGAPPETLVVKLAEVIGNFKTLRKMALFWCRIVAEVSIQYENELSELFINCYIEDAHYFIVFVCFVLQSICIFAFSI